MNSQRPIDGTEIQSSATDKTRRYIHVMPFLPAQAIPILAVLFLTLLHLISIFTFGRGFLLNRAALPGVNDCLITDSSCTLPRRHNKMVLLLVDALRADFIFPSSNTTSFTTNEYHHNILTLPAELTQKYPQNSFLAHFIADPPTTTLQRLKGLTTGSLPTFVDVGSSFGGEEIHEDSWLKQARRANYRVKMIGDDTWAKVFPPSPTGVWDSSDVVSFDSFNVEDLDTVDNGVRKHLTEMLDAQDEWDIIIAHGLGLDHAAHRHTSSHQSMTRKLQETQGLLQIVVDKMDNDTLLVLMGDHGMTDYGDHGGDTRHELEAGIWMYSKTPFTDSSWFEQPLESQQHPAAELLQHGSDYTTRSLVTWEEKGLNIPVRSVAQVDLVPTLSLLLGLPVPLGNLGAPIPELFWKSSISHEKEILSPLQTTLQAYLATSMQLEYYLSSYTSHNAGQDLLPFMPEFTFLSNIALSSYKGTFVESLDDKARFERQQDTLRRYSVFIRKVRERAKSVWATFDMNLIILGLITWLGSVLVAFKIWVAASKGVGARFVIGAGMEALFVGIIGLVGVKLFAKPEVFRYFTLYHYLCTLALFAEMGALSMTSPREILGQIRESASESNFWHLLVLFLHCASFGSNSFVVYEDAATSYLFHSVSALVAVYAFSLPDKRQYYKILQFTIASSVLVRLIGFSRVCREEQGPTCETTFYQDQNSPARWIILVLSIALSWFIPTIAIQFLKLSKSDEGMARPYLSLGVRTLLLSSSTYWFFDQFITNGIEDELVSQLMVTMKTSIARIIYIGAIFLMFIGWRLTPLCVRVNRRPISEETGMRQQVQVIGFANAYGSSYLLFFMAFFTLLWAVTPPTGQLVLGAQFLILLVLLECWDSQRDSDTFVNWSKTASVEQLLSGQGPRTTSHAGPTFLQISLLGLLAQIGFFGTGHQAMITTIQWSSAFIGFPTLTYPFAPVLVTLNSLSSYILIGCATPLFVFWKTSPMFKDESPSVITRHLVRACVGIVGYQSAVGLATAFFAAYFKRHLMVWKIFAPRFMLSSVSILAIDLVVLFLAAGWGALETLSKVRKSVGTRFTD